MDHSVHVAAPQVDSGLGDKANHSMPANETREPVPMKRYGSVIGLREDKVEDYRRLHAAAWPEVLKMVKECNIRNYSIYLRRMPDGRHYLFSYFEYTGQDFGADSAKMAADPVTREWWSFCEPCQQPLEDRAEGEWWAEMEEVFHLD